MDAHPFPDYPVPAERPDPYARHAAVCGQFLRRHSVLVPFTPAGWHLVEVMGLTLAVARALLAARGDVRQLNSGAIEIGGDTMFDAGEVRLVWLEATALSIAISAARAASAMDDHQAATDLMALLMLEREDAGEPTEVDDLAREGFPAALIIEQHHAAAVIAESLRVALKAYAIRRETRARHPIGEAA